MNILTVFRLFHIGFWAFIVVNSLADSYVSRALPGEEMTHLGSELTELLEQGLAEDGVRVVGDGSNASSVRIEGLIPSVRIIQEPLLRAVSDVKTGDRDFDKAVVFQVDGSHLEVEALSRLDDKQRASLRRLTRAGVRIENGQLHLRYLQRFGLRVSYLDKRLIGDVISVARAFSEARTSTFQRRERLLTLLSTDPNGKFRRRLLQRMMQPEKEVNRDYRDPVQTLTLTERDNRALLETLIRGDDTSPVTEQSAVAALELRMSLRALAASYWLHSFGGKECMPALARAMNDPSASPELVEAASRALAFLQRRHGGLRTGGLSMADTGDAGAVSLVAEGGQLEVAEGGRLHREERG